MVQNILRHLGRIDQYGVLSLCLFGALFLAILTWALLQTKGHMERMSRMPFENETPELSQTDVAHE